MFNASLGLVAGYCCLSCQLLSLPCCLEFGVTLAVRRKPPTGCGIWRAAWPSGWAVAGFVLVVKIGLHLCLASKDGSLAAEGI